MKTIKVNNYDEMSKLASQMIASQIREKPDTVLGLATGGTPVGTYKALVEMHRQDGLDFSRVTTFNLDEYIGLDHEHHQSYYYFMGEKLFNHVNIPAANIHIPNGMAQDTDKECNDYEQQINDAGGIDFQLLGVGSNGHIGFNEPEEVFYNKTRLVGLAASTIEANARFFNDRNEVPTTAISMGIGTIMSARKIVLIAGAEKLEVIKQLEKPIVSPQFPVSILHYHPNCTVVYAEMP